MSRVPWGTLLALGALMMVPAPWFGLSLAAIVAGALVTRAARRHRDAQRTAKSMQSGAVALGRDRSGRRVILSDDQIAAHGLVLGASGAGKSTTLVRLLSDRIERGMPVVAIDLKGSPAFAGALRAAALRAGRSCQVFSLDGDARWNPLAHGTPTELKDKLIATEHFTEPHYRRAAERYLQTALTVLAARCGGRAPTLEEVVELCDPRRLGAAARLLPSPLRERIADYTATLSPDQVSAIRGIGTRLALVTESDAGSRLHDDGSGRAIDLRAALRGESVVVFSLNSSTYGSLASQLGTIAVQDLVSAAGARLACGRTHPQALVAIDEFSALGADQVLALFARGREAGIAALLSTQELSDLDRAAHGLRDQVLGNTALKIVHRQDVPASARAVAQMTGTERVWEETRSFGGRGGLLPRGSRREVERFRVHPDTIASLPTGAAVVITRVPRSEVALVHVEPPALPAPVVAPSHPAVTPRRDARRVGAPGIAPPVATRAPARSREAPGRRGPRYPPPGVTR